MKSYKEMADNVFSRIVEEKEMEIKKHHNRVYMASTMAGFGLAILIGVGIWLKGQITVGEPGPVQGDNTPVGETQSEMENPGNQSSETEEIVVDYELLSRMEQAMWAYEPPYGEVVGIEPTYQMFANKFECEEPLCSLLTKNPDTIYAIGVVFDYEASETFRENYVWTSGEKYIDILRKEEDIRNEYGQLLQLRRMGPGIAKYLFAGEIDVNESWIINEDTIKDVLDEMDAELISKYFVNGEYLDELLEEDIVKNLDEQREYSSKKKEFDEAIIKAHSELIGKKMAELDVPVLVHKKEMNGYYYCYIFVTAEEFEKIELEKSQDYQFFLASKPNELANDSELEEE